MDSKVEAEPFLVNSSKVELCCVAMLGTFLELQQVPAISRGSASLCSFLVLLSEHCFLRNMGLL